ncbi:MAG: integrase core domain-containing protein [Chloroflexota bacterium]|nr:integrase core domain-containing protein [Chloroflexota bacterium]
MAERMNGILQLESALDSRFLDYQQARTATVAAVWLYNHERPHLALHYQIPVQVHR